MSLISFIASPDVRKRFAQEFSKPKVKLQEKLKVPLRSKNHMLIGTAFDYLMRFHLKHINPDAIEYPWIAEGALLRLIKSRPGAPIFQADGGVFDREEIVTRAYRYIGEARELRGRYIKSGRLTTDLINACLWLAQLDFVFRSGYVDPELGVTHNKDIRELRKLIKIVPAKLFKARKICVLNPAFGDGSYLVGGADADVVLDDTLIDVKTTTNPYLERRYFNQLVGYYALSRLGKISGVVGRRTIRHVAIYYSRHAILWKLPLREVVNEKRFPAFLKWFRRRAGEEFGQGWMVESLSN